MKVCRICDRELLSSDFYIDRGKARNECKDCTKEIRAKHYERNRDDIIVRVRRYRQAGIANKRRSERYAADPEYRRRAITMVQNRYHAGRASGGSVSRDEWEYILDGCDYRCVYCGEPWEHMDHVTPVSRGGVHAPSNVLPACSFCNLSKGARDPIEWFEETIYAHQGSARC